MLLLLLHEQKRIDSEWPIIIKISVEMAKILHVLF
jgi:hypothetical protein